MCVGVGVHVFVCMHVQKYSASAKQRNLLIQIFIYHVHPSLPWGKNQSRRLCLSLGCCHFARYLGVSLKNDFTVSREAEKIRLFKNEGHEIVVLL